MSFPVGATVYDITRRRFGVVITPSGAVAASSLPLLVQYTDPCGKQFTVNYTADGRLHTNHLEPVLRINEVQIVDIEYQYLWVLKRKDTGEYSTSIDYYSDKFIDTFKNVSTVYEFIEKIEHSGKIFRLGVR